MLPLLRHGRGLRHLPVILPDRQELSVRVMLHGVLGGSIDVTRDHVPVSLRPLVLGVCLDGPNAELSSPSLELRDEHDDDRLLARIELNPVGALPLTRGELRLFETSRCRNWTAPPLTRWTRYALAWQHARHARARGDGLCMSASDLRCLNAYYISARPVYLVGVRDANAVNFFPMDLVGGVSSGDFLLALRATSPAVEIMEASGRIAMSGAPASQLQAIYALGAHHHKATIDVTRLPFAVRQSELFGLMVLDEPGLVRELSVQAAHRVGSHVLFVTRIARESGRTEAQLAHVSHMYAEWLARHGRPLEALAPL
jgi:flavin reductase (DIM6/NTAB) family NADH-FMN oxidoreductase RutF